MEQEAVTAPLLERSAYIEQVVESFECSLGSVRFLKLEAGAVIDEHVDGGLCYEVGEARIHIPIVTNPELDFRLKGERVAQRGMLVYQRQFPP